MARWGFKIQDSVGMFDDWGGSFETIQDFGWLVSGFKIRLVRSRRFMVRRYFAARRVCGETDLRRDGKLIQGLAGVCCISSSAIWFK